MEHAFKLILLFKTLLQLCRAELSGSWYSANVINDGDFSPKPISELFSTVPPFSSTNPIVVLSQSTPGTPISTSMAPGSSSSFSTTLTPEFKSTYSTNPTTLQTFNDFIPSVSWQQPVNLANIVGNKPMFEPSPFPSKAKGNINYPNNNLIYQQGGNFPPTALQQTLSPFQATSSFQPSTLSTSPPLPEWSPPSTFSTISPQTFSTVSPSTFSTISPQISSNPSTISTFGPEISSVQTTFSTSPSTATNTQSTLFFTPSSDSTFPPTLPSRSLATSTPSQSTQESTASVSVNTVGTTTRMIPCNTTAPSRRNLFAKYPSLRIRMVAPSGSITNVNINPQTTTKRPVTTRRRTTTTRKPTTTRTQRTKRNRNTFNGCVNICEGRGRNPICAGPLAQIPVDPSKLKGFPSICHMACHNSFKRDQYEMLVEGRCGKLRTRIKSVNSGKLKRDELIKAQYTLVGGPETILEFSALPR